MERLFVLKTLSRTQRATKICGDLPETTAFKSYAANQYCDLPGRGQLSLSEVQEGTQQLSTTFDLAQSALLDFDVALLVLRVLYYYCTS